MILPAMGGLIGPRRLAGGGAATSGGSTLLLALLWDRRAEFGRGIRIFGLATNQRPSWRQMVLTFSDLPMKTSNLSTRLPKAARPCSTRRAVDRMGKERPSGQMSLRGTSARS